MPWLLETVRCRCGQHHLVCATEDNAPANGEVYLFECPVQHYRDQIAATSVTYLQILPQEAIRAVRANTKS